MTAGRRKGPPKRQLSNPNTMLCTSILSLIIALYICSFNLDSNDFTDNSPPLSRLATCRNTCDERLQSAALDSTLSFSLSPSSLDNILIRGGRQLKSEPSQVFDDNYKKSKPAMRQQQATRVPRPRRLPTLIKILTGFDDEPYWNGNSRGSSGINNNKPVIARIERPQLPPPARKRSRSSSRSKEGALSHKETVQIAAAAAATAVWSRSFRIFSDNRMQRINSEWDAALRWIAGWDQQLQLHSTSSWSDDHGGESNLEHLTASNNEALLGGMNGDVTQEGFNNFVDDLTKLLDTCISQCVDDVNFEARLRKDSEEVGGASITSVDGEMVSRSFLGRLGEKTSLRLGIGKLDMSLETRFFLTKAIQFVTSSVAICALLSLWRLLSPAFFRWYSSFGYKESPEWLLEHEKDIQLAKSARLRQKKKAKRRQITTRTGGRSKMDSAHDQVVKKNSPSGTTRENQCPHPSAGANASSNTSEKSSNLLTNIPCVGECQNECELVHLAPLSTDSVPGSPCSTSSGGVPSMISCPSTSVSSLPSIKPSSSLIEDNDPYEETLHAPSPPLLCLNSALYSQGLQIQHQKSLPVPTQEQRNEAAKQLREFQNAQIQRLVLQRKMSQAWCDGRPNDTSTTLCSGSSQHSGYYPSSTTSVGGRNKVIKPPPGLSLPSEPPLPSSNQDEKIFLTDNELFLAKLLDDEEEDAGTPPTRQRRIISSPPESSLDPTAAEFVSVKAVRIQQANATFLNSGKQEGDAWQSGPGDLSLSSNSPIRMMKGVYGGSVW